MFFKDYFISVADCLQAKFEGYSRTNQNPADKGELCESFMKDFLQETLPDSFRIIRGGKIVNIENKESRQLDIILCAKNTIKIFSDKGVYPIEAVYGVFSITAKLDFLKVMQCVKEFRSIPTDNPKFNFANPSIDKSKTLKTWKERFPYKCIWAYQGNMAFNWENELNLMAKNNPSIRNYLPDTIIINKKGMITKVREGDLFTDGGSADKDFHYTDFAIYRNYGACFARMLVDLYTMNNWQFLITPKYDDYFNADL